MPGPSIESFCERCGTKYAFEPPQQRGKRLKGLGRTLGLLAESAEPEAVGLVASRDPFHGTFHFCLDCRQYTCPNCWNEVAGFCQGCVPLPESPDLGGAEAFAVLEAETALAVAAAEHRLMGQAEAWPGVDLPKPEPELEPELIAVFAHESEPIVAFAPATEPQAEVAAEAEPDVELVYEAEPVEADAETVNAQLTRTLAELDHVEAEPVADFGFFAAQPEPFAQVELAAAELEPIADAEMVAASGEPEPSAEAEMVAATVEQEPIAADAEPSAAPYIHYAAEAAAPAELMPLAAAAADGVAEPDGLFERAWDVLYTQPATAEFTEDDPSAGDWAALAIESPVQTKTEAAAVAEPEAVAGAEQIAGAEMAAEPVAVVEPEVVFEAEPELVAEPALVAEPVAAAEVFAEPGLVAALVAAAHVAMPQPVAAAPEPAVEPQPFAAAAPEPVVEPQHEAMAPEPTMPIAPVPPSPDAPQAPIHMPAIAEPPVPTQPHLAPGWRMTAPDDASSVWPPHAPVYRPPTPPPPQAPIHQQKNGGNRPATQAGGHAASGIRPCYNCSLPVSASARFCRRCGSAQQTTGI